MGISGGDKTLVSEGFLVRSADCSGESSIIQQRKFGYVLVVIEFFGKCISCEPFILL